MSEQKNAATMTSSELDVYIKELTATHLEEVRALRALKKLRVASEAKAAATAS